MPIVSKQYTYNTIIKKHLSTGSYSKVCRNHSNMLCTINSTYHFTLHNIHNIINYFYITIELTVKWREINKIINIHK